VLTIERRPTEPVPIANFNHECYLPIYDAALADALRLALDQPGAWVRGRAESVQWFATESAELGSDASPVVRVTDAVYRIVDLQFPGHVTVHLLSEVNDPVRAPTTYSTVATLATATVGVAALVLSSRRARAALGRPELALAVIVTGGTVWWTFVTSVVGELGEQARFRTAVQPLAVTVAACLVWRLLRRSAGDRLEVRQEVDEQAGAEAGRTLR
jgi:hypothetical protein